MGPKRTIELRQYAVRITLSSGLTRKQMSDNLARRHNIGGLHPDQITAAKFTVDYHVQLRQIAVILREFYVVAGGQHVHLHVGKLLADDAAFIPRGAKCANGWQA